MESFSPTWAAYALAWVATVVIAHLSKHFHQQKLNLPPGPRQWPIIGNLNLIGTLPHRSLHQLSLTYGPLMHLQFGTFPVVVGSSVEMAKVFLKTMDVTFAGRPKTASGKYNSYDCTDMTWSAYGPYWRQARKIFLTELFSAKRLESYEHIRVEEMNSLLLQLFKSSGKPVVLKDYLSTGSLNVISRMVLGKTYIDESENSIVTPDEFRQMMDELFLLTGVFNIGDFIPWIDFLDLQGYIKRMKILSKKFDRFLEHVLDEHNAQRKDDTNCVSKDLVDVLLGLADDPTLEVKLERRGVKALTLDLLAGGTETSATTVEWAISELLKNPEIFNKAAEELDRVIGQNRWVNEKDMPNLPYIEAVVKETMRMHPPELFCPDRFMGKDIDFKGQDCKFLPFGAGRRMCPGYSLGLKVIQSSLANLLHGYRWKLPNDMMPEDLDMEEIFGLTTPRKIPLVAIVEPRLPRNLYSL
ncbi:unnamed protein product [Coffea canephora]|uniref:DH200=94 genomic scaffold, scaffold_7506 n=1 Tax=Coffea canephora TaxID=49390 RepID=A0A068VQ73_COFCA|nr:unnamed protein product [Coffea canephora]